MITFSRLGLHGRLGNALFQYALVKAVSEKTGHRLCLPDLSKQVDPIAGQVCKLTHFNIDYELLEESPKYLFREQGSGQYDPRVFQVPEGTDFFGHFQNKQFFDDIKPILKKELTLDDSIQQQAKGILSQFIRPTSIHVRLGDYLDMDQGVAGWQDKLESYINRARILIGDTGDILVFTGGKRHSEESSEYFDWCRDKIKGSNVFFMEGNSEVLDFELIRRCTNNICGWDSTFSWWASYLNENEGKIICTNKDQIFPWIYSNMREWITL